MVGGYGMVLEGNITGTGRGLGQAIAEGYAGEGAYLVLTAACEKKEPDEVAERLNILSVLADVSNVVTGQRIVVPE